jgi:GH25 family lysozyme M1 (1,4-beta-N-acetylmuramidase)
MALVVAVGLVPLLEAGTPSAGAQTTTSCPSGTPLRGVDVSASNGTIDWGQVAASGVSFGYAKIGSGGRPFPQFDPSFLTNYAGMRAAGITPGAYFTFVGYPDGVGLTNEINMVFSALRTAGYRPGDLRPVIEFDNSTTEYAGSDMQEIAKAITAGFGTPPVILTSAVYWNSSFLLGPQVPWWPGTEALWVREEVLGSTGFVFVGASCPTIPARAPYGWARWSVWQYADNGSVPGIGGAVDLDQSSATTLPISGTHTSISVSSSANPATYGSPVTFTATVTGGPLPFDGTRGDLGFRLVNFSSDAFSGPCATEQQLSLVNGSYQASCTVIASGVGSHTLTASYSGTDLFPPSATTMVEAVNPAPLTVTASSASMIYGDPVPTIGASYSGLVNGDIPPTTQTVLACSTTGNSSSPAGAYPTSCSLFPSSYTSNYAITYVDGALTIAKRPASLSYTGPLMVSTGAATSNSATVTVQAQVTQTFDGSVGDITKSAPINFLFYKSSNTAMSTPDATCTATSVDAAGVAACSLDLATDNWTVVAQEPTSNGFYTAPDSDPAVLTVYAPQPGANAHGGGWVTDPSTQNLPVAVSSTNPHGNFGFSVRYKPGTTTPQGQAIYVFRGSDGYDYVIKANSWQGGGFTVTGANQAVFSGKAGVTVIDPSTGLPVPGLGGGNFTYKIEATDTATSTYALQVYDSAGHLYHQAGTSTQPIPLGGGNITLQAS